MFPLFNFTRAVLRRVGSELDMAERKSVALHVRELVAPTADELGLKLWDVEYVKEGADYVLRITIDSDEGITIDDCERFHRAIDPVIDEDDPIENSYKLEVSSPGVERVLTRPEHFEEFLPDYKNLEELEDHYRRGGLGDVKVKKFLNNVMQAELTPIRERRKEWEARIPDVYDILKAGSAVAEKRAAETMTAVKKAMQIDYFG